MKQRLLAVVVTLSTSADRAQNVARLQECMHTAGADTVVKYGDLSGDHRHWMCTHGIHISGQYRTPVCSGANQNCPPSERYIHSGKLGLWLSWLDVMVQSDRMWKNNTFSHVLWLEDDVILTPGFCRKAVSVAAHNRASSDWFSREGPYNSANLINTERASDFMAQVQRDGIMKPLDLYVWTVLKRKTPQRIIGEPKLTRLQLPSTIRRSPFLPIDQYDKPNVCKNDTSSALP
jgi:hypothetical protein